jgi:FMN-dependent NADH-azoreductase
MKKLLVINSSAKALNSCSRGLTEVFVDHWRNMHINPVIRFRELANTDVPHVNEHWIAAAFKPQALRSEKEIDALKASDAYISELREADVIVLGAPMYNWSVPSSLKAYIDQVIRVNETFKVDRTDMEHPYIGLLENKTLVLLLSRGELAYERGGYNEHMDFQTAYLKTVFHVMGIRHSHVIAVNGASADRDKFVESMAIAHRSIKDLVEQKLVRDEKRYR